MKKVIVNRFKVDFNYSIGHCYIIEDTTGIVEYVGCTLERGWRDNQKNISCVPEGSYPLKLEYSPRFRMNLWELYEVPKRAECKFHAANYWSELNGCIALGAKFKDLNKDGAPDITSSRNTMKLFHKMLEDQVESEVKIKNITF